MVPPRPRKTKNTLGKAKQQKEDAQAQAESVRAAYIRLGLRMLLVGTVSGEDEVVKSVLRTKVRFCA